VPYQVGVHSSYIIQETEDKVLRVRDYENTRIIKEIPHVINFIEFGTDGKPPPLPETRGKKLIEVSLVLNTHM
jgi:hypothetical protein